MLHALASWARRNTRRALALAVAPGLAVGLTGTWFHFTALGRELGDYSWPAIEGGLSVAPPAFAPLGFAAVGVLLWLLPRPRLLLRLRIGRRRESVVRALGGPR